MNAKIHIKNQLVGSFGGIFPFLYFARTAGIKDIFHKILGNRRFNAKFSYSYIVENLATIFLTGGTCLEDITREKDAFSQNPAYFKTSSPDTIAHCIKELAEKESSVETKSGKKYTYAVNTRINGELLEGLMATNMLSDNGKHTFDYDNQFTPTEKYDAKYSYKGKYGYFPGVAQVDGYPFYVENRDGNMNVKHLQSDVLRRAFGLAEAKGIMFDKARMDCGSYSKDIVEETARHCDKFFIRAIKSDTLRGRIAEIAEEDWKVEEINNIKCHLTSVPFTAFLEERGYRLVVQRTVNREPDLFSGEYIYRCILTNDHYMSNRNVVKFYNQRGKTERCFDCMNNDFGWKHMPFSFMRENLVFMVLTAFVCNLYKAFIKRIARLNFGLKSTSRAKDFIYKFMTVPFRWTHHGRQWQLELFTCNAAYLKLRL